MKFWILALVVQLLIMSLGFGLMGEAFVDISILHAPVVNLLLWTGLITFAGLAASAAQRPIHRWLTWFLLAVAVIWFPVSLLIFGNARFSHTTAFLWQSWLIGTTVLVLGILLSLAASAITGLFRRWRFRAERFDSM
jgi:hypothetical protein